jgi:hypothetical protein
MSIRHWLFWIAMIAIICAAARLASWYRKWSPLRTRAALHASSEQYARGQHDHFVALLKRHESNPMSEPLSAEELERCREAVRRWAMAAEWRAMMRRKYEQAAQNPWEPIAPDPPPPWQVTGSAVPR